MILLGKVAMGLGGAALACAGLLCSEGFVNVNVQTRYPESHHVHIIAPALIVPLTLHFVPKEHLKEGSCEIREWTPAIRAALQELRKAEDIAFVEVKERGQHVLVKKEGASIVVDVEDEDDSVHISTPIRALESTFEELAAAAPAETQ